MGQYYYFYNPNVRHSEDIKLIADGKYAGMPFDYRELPCELKEVSEYTDCFNICYGVIGIMDRKMAEKLQTVMDCNKTFFTDLMDEYGTDVLIYKTE